MESLQSLSFFYGLAKLPACSLASIEEDAYLALPWR
jgi:hypothetical protein